MRREAHGRAPAEGRRQTRLQHEFKRTAVQRILTGEETLAELSRELDISPRVIRNCKRFAEAGATTAVQASEDVVPASHLGEAYARSESSSARWAARRWRSRSCGPPRRS